MKKTVHTAVDFNKAAAIASHLGCNVKPQSSFIQVSFGEHTDRRIYISNSKTGCTRIDLSGFTHELGVEHRSPPTSMVVQEVNQDATRTEPEILRDLARIIKEGLVARSTPAVVGKRKEGKTVVQASQAEIDAAVLLACGEDEGELDDSIEDELEVAAG